jgi:predicted P-loop ATPase
MGALEGYLAKGWPVLPVFGVVGGACTCREGAGCSRGHGKHPNCERGVYSASLDKAFVEEWAARWPSGNWAVACGHPLPDGGYLTVLDIDPRADGDINIRGLEAQYGPLPNTPHQISGGSGWHEFYRTDEPIGGATLADGVEIKGLGGYIVIAPSNHISGGTYRPDAGHHWDDTPIARMPDWLRTLADTRVRERPDIQEGVDAKDSFLGVAFEAAGWLGRSLPNGQRCARCPWHKEHSGGTGAGKDSSCVILPPTKQSNFGLFKCSHSHGKDKRTKEVLAVLPDKAKKAARQAFPVQLVEDVGWKSELKYHTKEKADGSVTRTLEKCVGNVMKIVLKDERWLKKITHNEFNGRMDSKDPPWPADMRPAGGVSDWTDNDDVRLQAWLREEYGLNVDKKTVADAVSAVAEINKYHPVRDYMNALAWDGKPRVDSWLSVYLGAEDNAYTRMVGKFWLLSVAARVFEPGCKVDYLLVLEGKQAIGKSSFLADLLPDRSWFASSKLNMGTKEAVQSLIGKLIYELEELASLKKSEIETVKSFITTQSDWVRLPYARRCAEFKRQTVFVGTTNEDQYLTDPTGNRRFWPVKAPRPDREAIVRDRDQLWAEVMQRRGEAWWPTTPEETELCTRQQETRVVRSEWEDVIRGYVERQPPGHEFTVREILDLMGIAIQDYPRHEKQAAISMRRVGLERQPRRDKLPRSFWLKP